MTIPFDDDRPFGRAWILLALVQSSFGTDHWYEVCRRAQTIDDRLHIAATRRLGEAIAGHPQSRALHALSAAARNAAAAIESVTQHRPGTRRRPLTREARDFAGRALGYAVLSLALAPRLEPVDVALLTSPVLTTLRSVEAGPPDPSPPGREAPSIRLNREVGYDGRP